MTVQNHLSIAGFVTENERAAVRAACRHVAASLSQAAETPWTCEAAFVSDLEALRSESGAAILITSLLPELERVREAWPEAEQRLHKAYAALAERDIPVFVCTVLRHIDSGVGAEAAALRLRLRKLNLLAAEISRESGIFVIDLDRVLADVGARRLQTDYRLAGNAAAEMAGHFTAVTLVTNGIDALVPFEIQDAARALLLANRPGIAGMDSTQPEITIKKALLSLGQGRRKQIVATVGYTEDENYAGWLVRQVLRGAIGPGEALRRLFQAVRRRGVRASATLLATGLSRQINRKK
jgi:hypothetical protein